MKTEIFAVMLALGLGFFGRADAILSPLSQSAVEIKAIVEDKRLSEMFGESEEIQKIVKTPHGYIVVGLKHKVRVIVEYKRQNQPGPKPFDLLFLTPETK
jgi:hypothetical protein